MIRQVGRSIFLEGHHTRTPREQESSVPKILGPYVHQNGLTCSDKISYDNTCGKSLFLGSITPHLKGTELQHP